MRSWQWPAVDTGFCNASLSIGHHRVLIRPADCATTASNPHLLTTTVHAGPSIHQPRNKYLSTLVSLITHLIHHLNPFRIPRLERTLERHWMPTSGVSKEPYPISLTHRTMLVSSKTASRPFFSQRRHDVEYGESVRDCQPCGCHRKVTTRTDATTIPKEDFVWIENIHPQFSLWREEALGIKFAGFGITLLKDGLEKKIKRLCRHSLPPRHTSFPRHSGRLSSL